MKSISYSALSVLPILFVSSCNTPEDQGAFPFILPKEKPKRTLSTAVARNYDDFDGTITRRDPSKVLLRNGKYYVWYTHRATATPPRGAALGSDTIPSTDWDLAEVWYATSNDGFTWPERGVAIPRPPKPHPGWRSVSTADILVWEGEYYLYCQGLLEMSGKRGDDCPVTASVADSPDGPWRSCNRVVIPNGIKHNTVQYAPDGISFKSAAVSSLKPEAYFSQGLSRRPREQPEETARRPETP